MIDIEPVAGCSWKAVELYWKWRLWPSQFCLQFREVTPAVETNSIATPRSIIIIEPFTWDSFCFPHLPTPLTSSSISLILQQSQVQMNFLTIRHRT